MAINKGLMAVLAMSSVGIAHAGMYVPRSAPVAAAPAAVSPWVFGLEALYVQPSDLDNIDLLEIDSNDFSVINNDVKNIQPEWSWGFRINLGYNFQDDIDLNLNWSHFDADNDDDDANTIFGNNENIYIGTAFLPDPNHGADSWTEVSSSISDKYDQVNLEIGKTAKFGEHSVMRFFAGLSYLNIDQDLEQDGSVLESLACGTCYAPGQPAQDALETEDFDSSSNFTGFGPRLGATYSYLFGNGFSLVATAAMGIFIGDIDYSANWVNTFDGDVENVQALDSDIDNEIVPGAEGRIGVNYAFALANGATVGIEGGYQVNYYWNATVNQDLDQNPYTDDFSFSGVYLGVNVVV